MRTVRTVWALGGVTATLLSAMSCSAPCEEKGTCGPANGTGATAGMPAASGTSGGAGRGGSAGMSGVGGSSAEGGQAGSDGGSTGVTGGAGGATAGRGGSGGTAGGAGSAGVDNMGGQGGAAPSCDETKSPSEEACLVSNDYAVFVSPSGDDGGSGKKTDPVKTLAKALRLAHDASKIVVACSSAGSFSEQVSVTDAIDGSRLYGGFDCDTWKYDKNQKTTVTSTQTTALRIDNLTDGTTIEDFAFEAADATMPGESSLGAFVTSSTGVELRRVQIQAGLGQDGANGTLEEYTYADQSSLSGNGESVSTPGTGGGEKTCMCQSAPTIGGTGGVPSSAGTAGSKGLPDHGAGQPGTPGSCASGGTGFDGANAPTVMPGNGAATRGFTTVAGWMPASGEDGPIGEPGQGGGGGASRNNLGHGGGGGCGGCGGNGGKGGQGGGASIALLIVDSEVDIADSDLVSSNAGKGGNGHTGQPGQMQGGPGGAVVSNVNSCPGGAGGFGADGGAGGGGAGGVSVGILWRGDAPPNQKGVTFKEGAPGSGGIGGSVGINDGIDGIAQEMLAAT